MRNSQHSLSSNGSDQLELLEEYIGEFVQAQAPQQSFRNLYWSGVVSLQLPLPGGNERRPIGPDVLREKELYEDLEEDHNEGWQLLFDPQDFNDRHKPLSMAKFALPKQLLYEKATALTKI